MNNTERETWVINNEGLYRRWKSSHLSMRNFLRENRQELDRIIDREMNPKKYNNFYPRNGAGLDRY